MRCIVTGGAGFIGSHLTERLLKEGHQVTVLDNFATGRIENLAHVKRYKKLNIINLDIRIRNSEFSRSFQRVDWVFHLAALADIVPSISDPVSYIETNVTGTFNVAEACRINGCKKLVYAASTSCYGIPDSYPTSETAPIKPQYPYALSKWMGEELLFHWHKVYGLPVISLRLFNVYGPRSRTNGTYGAVFGIFLAQKLAGKPFTVVGDGTQSRDFTFVSDVVEAFYLAAKSRKSGEVYNAGTGKPTTINEIVRLLGGKPVYIPKRPGEPDSTMADFRKIKKQLGWKPKVGIQQGISTMLDNIEYWKHAVVWTPAMINKATKQWFDHLDNKN